MEPGSQPLRLCDRCGSSDDLYLLTLRQETGSPDGNAAVCCAGCRAWYTSDVAVPLALVTPRLLLGLQRLRKLDANLGRLLAAVEFG